MRCKSSISGSSISPKSSTTRCACLSRQEFIRDYYAFAEELIHGAIDHMDRIDAAIMSHASNWKFERIAKVDLSILRLAIYELLVRTDIPPIVSINEAIDLSKVFSNRTRSASSTASSTK